MPVTVVNRHHSDDADSPSASHAALEAELRTERLARKQAQREQQDALWSVQNMQTMLGHAELARQEASAIAERVRAAADALRAEHQERELRWQDELGAERAARLLAEAALAETTRAREPALDPQDASPQPVAKAPAKTAAKRTRKAAAEPRQGGPQPVKWWLKSARTRWP